jgi:N-acetylmuramoyl-L-alanine amidase
MKKRIWILLLALSVMAVGPGALSASAKSANLSPEVYVSGARMVSDVGAQLVNGTTYVPLRAFCQSMAGSTVTWDEASRTAKAISSGVEISVTAGKRYMTVNNRCFYLPQGALIVEGRLMLPIRLLAKAYGAEVGWNQATATATVSAAGTPLAAAGSVYNSDDLYWLARIIRAESQGESLEGKMAVGNVVLNRVASTEYPDSVYEVIFDKTYGTQFTPTASGTIYNEPDAESIVAAKLCLEGYNVAGDSLYFFNKQKSQGTWIVQNCNYVATIGNHTFYV